MDIASEKIMELELYYKLSTCSRRAIRRRKGAFGRPYYYRPRGNLLARLAEETGRSKEEIFDQLMKERDEILSKTFSEAL